ncbi:MAG: AAA family ATPase [Nocardioidaceae bacterium]
MLLHRLKVTAFGPFADTEVVDFDPLNDAGLFLLAGSTGAGKTSILDAVCFGLFGDVPGDRHQAKRLRSDHAAAGVRPRVELEATMGGRRFRFVRQPEWWRPKKRGEGTTKEQPHVAVDELLGGVWTNRATRIDEAQQLVGSVLGMNIHQFTQVVLLPQGRFQAFLRAGADERQKVLEQLFSTGRFRSMEAYLVDRRRRADAAQQVLGVEARSQLDQMVGVADDGEPAPEEPDDWLGWANRALHRAERALVSTGSAAQLATQRAQQAQSALQEAVALDDRRVRGRKAQEVLTMLADEEKEAERVRQRLSLADRAAALRPLLTALDAATVRHDEALDDFDTSLPDEVDSDPDRSPDDWVALLSALRTDAERRAERLESLRPQIEQVAELAAQLPGLRAAESAAAGHAARAATALAELPGRIEAATGELRTAGSLAAQVDALRESHQRARSVASAAQALPAAELSWRRADEARRHAVDSHQQALDLLQRLTQRRLDGAAAELASRLAEGRPCAVCGATDHPSPAPAVADLPTEHDTEAAADAVEAARAARVDAERVCGSASDAVTALRARVEGVSVQDAVSRTDQTYAALETAVAAAGQLPGLQRACEDIRQRLQREQGAQRDHTDALASARERVEAACREQAALRTRISEHLGDDHDLSVHLESAAARRAEMAGGLAAAQVLADETRALRRALEHADAEASTSGFFDAAEAHRHTLARDERDRLQRWLAARTDRQAAAHATLEEPAVAEALAHPPLDVTAQRMTVADADADAAQHVGAASRAASRHERLTGLQLTLAGAVAAWTPARQAHAVAARMSQLAEGKSVDNQLRMSLSAYVLAARLVDVVAAANERLGPMTDGRYQLEHTSARTGRDQRGGLGLLVADAWTGEARDPATLSGGETFQASLALALGLADVVSHEAGGLRLHTLFVDEGFGSLDADSLDEVMDVLDTLREGGRVVGVVSHVDAMRERIKTQVSVVKGRTGSRVTATLT